MGRSKRQACATFFFFFLNQTTHISNISGLGCAMVGHVTILFLLNVHSKETFKKKIKLSCKDSYRNRSKQTNKLITPLGL